MLLIPRTREESIVVSGSDGGLVLTVLHVRGGEVSLLVTHSSKEKPGELNTWTTKLVRDASFEVGGVAEVKMVDVRGEHARIGITAPVSVSVHRLEVWEAIKREQRRTSGDAEDGMSGSPVPRPHGPKPPSLDVRMDEPPASDGGGE